MTTSTDTLTPTIAQLRPMDLFDELTASELEPWAEAATLHEAAPGERIAERGSVGQGVIFLLEGRLDMLFLDGEIETRQGTQEAPTWVGVVQTLLGTPSAIALCAATPVHYAVIGSEQFIDLTLAHRSVFTRAMASMKPVMGRVAQRQVQNERMEALGTMAAGLAHELNNPASAARQAARDLTETLGVLSKTVGVFVESGVEREEAGGLVALQMKAMERCAAQTTLSGLEAADREDELTDALTDLEVPEPWTLASTLAAAGLDAPYLQEVAATAGPLTNPVLRWISASLLARQLAADITESTTRMSELVIAIKKYAYARPGQVDDVDLRDGLETTLTLLKHKLKHTSITVTRDYDDALGTVAAFGSELNQVWTNLLDNAIDVLGEQGQITIATRLDGDCAEVDIGDDGPGIPPEIARRVFDPFFTTKDVGKGTGLGLDTARRIIVDRHHGSLSVQSKPGATVFCARIPLDAARR